MVNVSYSYSEPEISTTIDDEQGVVRLRTIFLFYLRRSSKIINYDWKELKVKNFTRFLSRVDRLRVPDLYFGSKYFIEKRA